MWIYGQPGADLALRIPEIPDENFKIIDAYAPPPSLSEAVELLDKILKK